MGIKLGSAPLELVQHIARRNTRVSKLALWLYHYVPLQVNENPINQLRWIKKDSLNESCIEKLQAKLQEQIQIGIWSKVKLENNKYGHIPMMDFELNKSARNLAILIERLRKCGISDGWILETGDSYHYYGSRILSEREWIDFMAKMLLTSIVHTRDNIEQVADPRYIGHSLRRGGCVLRLTTRADKTHKPTVVFSFK